MLVANDQTDLHNGGCPCITDATVQLNIQLGVSNGDQEMNVASKYAAIVIAGLTLTACAGMIRSIDSDDTKAIRKVAVASQLGNTFNGSLTATTVLGNSSYTADVSDWHVDRTLTAAAIEAIQRGGERTALALPSNSDLAQLLQAARAHEADTLLLVKSTRYSNQPDFPPGYGLHRRTFFGIDRSCIYSLFVAAAYNVKSGSEIGLAWSFPVSSGIPCAGTTDVAWKDDFGKYTPEERESIRKAIISSVRTNVQTSLKGLGLTP